MWVRRIHRRRAFWHSRWRDLVWEKQGHRGREIATNLDDVFVSRAIAAFEGFSFDRPEHSYVGFLTQGRGAARCAQRV